MNKLEKISISGVAGTSFMILFSYLASLIEKENFREPEHLASSSCIPLTNYYLQVTYQRHPNTF
jgi:hypothetical protein